VFFTSLRHDAAVLLAGVAGALLLTALLLTVAVVTWWRGG
jgi:hypothetical protein